MKRIMGLLLAVSAVVAPSIGSAQSLGDSVRVESVMTQNRVFGRFVALDGIGIRVRTFMGDTVVRRANIARVDVYKRTNAALAIITGGVVGGATWGLLAANTGSQTTDRSATTKAIAIGTASGLVLGALTYLILPGDWHRVEVP